MTLISSIFTYLSVKISTSSSNLIYPARPGYHRSKTMSCLILTELPVKPFVLLMHGQGLVDEGLARSLQDLPCLLRIIAGSHRLKKPIDDGKKNLAPSRHAGCAGQVLSTLQRRTCRPLDLWRLRGRSTGHCCCCYFAGILRRRHRCAGHHHLGRLY
jgi:hypothetical protein